MDNSASLKAQWGIGWLVAYDVMLFFMCVIASRMAKFYPGYAIFWITLALGLFVVLIATMINFVIASNERRKAELRQQGNIVPGYCPDYWTKAFDDKKNVVCNNGFATKDANGRMITYKFSDPKVRDTVSLAEITKSTNPYKCNTYGNPVLFPAPWLELKAKCEVVSY